RPGLLVNRGYKVQVSGTASDNTGTPLPAPYVTGFSTYSPSPSTIPPTLNDSASPMEAETCATEFPTSITLVTGTTGPAESGLIFESAAAVRDPTVAAQFGYGPRTANPEYESGWTWISASLNATYAGASGTMEYMATVVAPSPGTYGYVYRFSREWGST